jgi:hypothetical protein
MVAMGLAATVSLSIGTTMKMVHKTFKEISIKQEVEDLKAQINNTLHSSAKCPNLITLGAYDPAAAGITVPNIQIPRGGASITIGPGYVFPGGSGLAVVSIGFTKEADAYLSGGGGFYTEVSPATTLPPAYANVNTQYWPILGKLSIGISNSAAQKGLVMGSATVTLAFPVSLTRARRVASLPWYTSDCGSGVRLPQSTSSTVTGWLDPVDLGDPSKCTTVTYTVTKPANPAWASTTNSATCPAGMYVVKEQTTLSALSIPTRVNNCRCVPSGKNECSGSCYNACDPFTGAWMPVSSSCDGDCAINWDCTLANAGAVNTTFTTILTCCKVRRG